MKDIFTDLAFKFIKDHPKDFKDEVTIGLINDLTELMKKAFTQPLTK